MITEAEAKKLITDMESDWIERTTSIREDKLGPAICAYSNDFPNHKHSGYILLAEAMKVSGYVNRFNYGVKRAIAELLQNGNGKPEFDLSLITNFKVTIPLNKQWLCEQ